MKKAMAASALIHFGLIAGAWAAIGLPSAVDESDAESVSVSIISMEMVSTDPSEVVTQTSQNLVSAGAEQEAMEVPATVESVEASEPEPVQPVEDIAVATAEPEVIEAEAEDQASAAVLVALADSVQPVEAAIPQVTSETAAVVADTVTPALADAPVQEASLAPLPEEIVEEAEAAPVPMPRLRRAPVETAEAAKPREQPEKKAEPKPKKQPPSKQANLGNGGAAEADTRASARSGGGRGSKDDGGSAAASKYEGQVQAKVNRAVRKVATRRGGRGILRFALGPGGNVLSVTVLDSSGDPAIDAAAVAAVNRAAPYPPIPPDTGKSSWTFGLPFGDK